MDRMRSPRAGRWEELPLEQTQTMAPELVDQAIGESTTWRG